ncbi:MAG: molybdopterin-dependent oxidoreductase, partial [Actinomycetota bacterium]|nr:molybdopterin-dependent oxidoreductase [Actinomycetota bacterium]
MTDDEPATPGTPGTLDTAGTASTPDAAQLDALAPLPAAAPATRPVPQPFAAAAGLVAGAAAVTLGMLAAAITEVVSPIDAVGSEVIDRSPRSVKEWAIREFGTDDKLVLRIGIITILALAAIAVGLLARRRSWAGWVGIGAFGVVGALAAAHRPGEAAGATVPSILGAIAGAALLHHLLRPRAIELPGPSQAPLGWDRRRFLIVGGSAAATAAVAGGTAQAIEGRRVERLREATRRPLPAAPSADLDFDVPPDAQLFDETPFVTPNGDFYRIDTALSFPRIDIGSWGFTISGKVDNPLRLTYDDLLALPQVERMVTLCCVSNEVGGEYIGNAVWRGVMLRDLLDRAGVHDDAEQVFSTSLDGWTCGFPVAAAVDGRDAMVVVGMNGETLPLEHGYPARLVVPGLYGYVSATKWLADITLTTWDDRGYWVPRGWASEAPIKT